MPPYEVEAMTSWADRVELEEQTEGDLPAPTEHFDERKGIKIITEYKFNEDGKKVKIVRTFKIEKRKVAKSIATRKSSWKKFGASKNDKPGPDPATTIPSEEIYMQFVSAKDGDSVEGGGASTAAAQDDDPMNKLKGQKIVQCRVCKGDHWTTKCPYKDKLAPIEEKLPDDLDGVKEGSPAGPGAAAAAAKPAPGGPPPGAGGGGGGGGGGAPPGKYVPPSLRGKDKAAAGDRGPGGGGGGGGESMPSNRSRDEAATIRVSNLPEDIRESDLQELFRSFGGIARIYLAKDKVTHTPKGFAFINFHKREDAAKAIAGVSGYGYDHLILNVEWAKPSGN